MSLAADGFARVTHVSRETLARLEDYVRCSPPGTGASIWSARTRSAMSGAAISSIRPSFCSHLPPGTRRVGRSRQRRRAARPDPGDSRGARGPSRRIRPAQGGFPARGGARHPRPGDASTPRAPRRVPAVTADVVTARACAPLAGTAGTGVAFHRPDTICLFLKGRGVGDELTAAAKDWNMLAETMPSVADKSGCILKLEGISRVERR